MLTGEQYSLLSLRPVHRYPFPLTTKKFVPVFASRPHVSHEKVNQTGKQKRWKFENIIQC